MTTLTFGVHARELGDLPIEVRTPNMALVARTLASERLDVEPGTYFVTMRLPTGEETTERVRVTRADDVVEVQMLREHAAGAQSASVGAFKGVPARPIARATPGDATRDSRAPADAGSTSIELWTGNVFAGGLKLERVLELRRDERASVEWSDVPGRDVPQFARIVSRQGPAVWSALPAWAESSCRLLVEPSLPTHTQIVLEHQQANLLLYLHETGRVGQAEGASRSRSLAAEGLLYQKRRDPIAAVVGAYALLRFNDVDRLHEWTKNLQTWFPRLPDAAVIRGEHLARLGEHEHSLAALLDLPARGLPLFAEGMTVALDRLRLYSRHGGDLFPADRIRAAAALMQALGRAAAVTDFSKPVTTLSHVNPDEPLRGAAQ